LIDDFRGTGFDQIFILNEQVQGNIKKEIKFTLIDLTTELTSQNSKNHGLFSRISFF